MAWFLRFTRFVSVHAVYAQENENSCGIASVIMVNFKLKKDLILSAASTASIPYVGPAIAKKLTGAALDSAIAAEKEVYKIYGNVSGKTYDGSVYTFADELAKTLNKLGIGNWEAKFVGETSVAQAVLDSVTKEVPIIMLTNWDVGGGHFVVCDEVNGSDPSYASVCDPWDGDVHVVKFKKGETFRYLAEKQLLSWDIGGIRHEYATASGGKMNGWVVRQV